MSFNFYLVSLFIIGCGLVVLEAAANPYVTELGDRATAASRLNLAQSFNGLGCILAPVIVGQLLFTENGESNVALPYTIMGAVVLFVAVSGSPKSTTTRPCLRPMTQPRQKARALS